jgi:ketosteroid isomerase-like protein
MYSKLLLGFATLATTLAAPLILAADKPEVMTDSQIVAALDTEYQALVERNDWQGMDRILHPDFMLVLGNGTVVSRSQLIEEARGGDIVYEKQVEMPGTQTVRLYGEDTAIVTALLWLKYQRKSNGKQQDYKLWFSDTYVRTKDGWKYAFGQASTRLP